MYHFIDRPIAALEPDRLLLLRAMRLWVLAAHRRHCPCATLANWFDDYGAQAAMPHFRMMMAALHRDAREPLAFGLPDCARVTEDEAVLLALADDAVGAADRRTAAAQLVAPCAADILDKALAGIADGFANAARQHRDRLPRNTGDTH